MLDEEIVWVPKQMAEEIKNLREGVTKEDLILSYIKLCKSDLQSQIESMDEDVIIFQGLMAKARQSFEKAKNEHLTAAYDLWESFDKDLPSTRKKVESMISSLGPLVEKLQEVDDLMRKIRSYDIEKLLALVNALSCHFNHDGQTGKMLKFLFDNYTGK